jgi:hypothetical protein
MFEIVGQNSTYEKGAPFTCSDGHPSRYENHTALLNSAPSGTGALKIRS